MSQVIQCTGCQKKYRLNAAAPGKVFKCSSCGTKFTASPPREAAIDTLKPEPPLPVPSAKDKEADPARPRKRRRRKQRQSATVLLRPLKFLFQPLAEVGSIAVTPARLAVLVAILGSVSWFLYSHNFFGEPKVSVAVVHAFGWRDLPVKGSKDVMQKAIASTIMRQSVIVTEPDPQGAYILVKFTLTEKVLEQAFGNKAMSAHLDRDDLTLQAGGQKLHPTIFLVDQLHNEGVTLYYSPPSKKEASSSAKKAPPTATDSPNSSGQASKEQSGLPPQMHLPAAPWGANDGQLTSRDSGWHFQGAGGLAVDCKVAGAPDYSLHVSWDPKASGWVGDSVANPSPGLSSNWDMACLFRKPETTEGMTMLLLGQPIPLRWAK